MPLPLPPWLSIPCAFPRIVFSLFTTPKGRLEFCGSGSEEVAERAEVEVQVAVLEPELGLELLHAALELHERLAEPLDLLVGEVPLLHPVERLPLHELTEELDEREDELREALLDLLGVGVHPSWKRALEPVELARDRVEVAGGAEQPVEIVSHASPPGAKLYGAHGPVHANASCGCSASSSATRLRNASTSPDSTR